MCGLYWTIDKGRPLPTGRNGELEMKIWNQRNFVLLRIDKGAVKYIIELFKKKNSMT